MRAGLALFLVGACVRYKDSFPWLRLLGRLPGDIAIQREGFQFYFPVVTCLLLSGIGSLILWLLRRG